MLCMEEEYMEDFEELLNDLGIEDCSDQRDAIREAYQDMLNYMDPEDALAALETIIRGTRENFG